MHSGKDIGKTRITTIDAIRVIEKMLWHQETAVISQP